MPTADPPIGEVLADIGRQLDLAFQRIQLLEREVKELKKEKKDMMESIEILERVNER